MSRKLYICSTVYQLVVAVHIKMTIHSKSDADIILTDEMPNVSTIAAKLNSKKIFMSIVVVHGKESALSKGKLAYIPFAYRHRLKDLSELFGGEDPYSTQYDEILFANIGGLNYRIASSIADYNRQAEVSMFEEGVSSYSKLYGQVFNEQKKIKNRICYKTLYKTSRFYFFDVRLPVWKWKMKFICIPPIELNKNKICRVLNDIFGYEKLKDRYSEKVIFFEESYVTDGIKVDDVELVEELARTYGKENILVKTHPRDTVNRFAHLGYKTNRDKSIPWEVVALNMDLKDKILVSMTSTAVVNSMILLHSPCKILLDYENMPQSNERVKSTIEVIENIKNVYPDAIS